MRFAAIFPFFCALAAFILALLAVLAGSRQDFMQNFDMLTLNTSRLGHIDFNSTLGSGILNSLENELGDQAEDIVTGVVDDIAEVLNIHDFYSVHLLDYCEGYYEPSPVINATNTNPSKNFARCTDPKPFARFNPTEILQSELRPGISLSDLQWPSEVETAVQAIEIAMRAMFVLYCIGIGSAGLSIIGALITFFTHGLFGATINFMLDLVSLLHPSLYDEGLHLYVITTDFTAAELLSFGRRISNSNCCHSQGRRRSQRVWEQDWCCSISRAKLPRNHMDRHRPDASRHVRLDCGLLCGPEEEAGIQSC